VAPFSLDRIGLQCHQERTPDITDISLMAQPSWRINMQLAPLFDRVLVREIEPSATTPGGILLLDTLPAGTAVAEVIAAGPGRRNKDGRYVGMAVQVGQKVVYPPRAGQIVTIKGEELLMLEECDLMAIVVE
jgi:chaperonin GroES